jgi:hypothetical protein
MFDPIEAAAKICEETKQFNGIFTIIVGKELARRIREIQPGSADQSPVGPILHFGPMTLPSTAMVLLEVAWERIRQDKKWGEQNIPDGTGSDTMRLMADLTKKMCQEAEGTPEKNWAKILLEEVFEAAEEVDEEKLETELIQVAAVAVEWVEGIRRRRQNDPNRKPALEAK